MRFKMAAHPRLLRLTNAPLTRLAMASDGVTKRDVVTAFSGVRGDSAVRTLELDIAGKTARRQRRKCLSEKRSS
jgi:hypothetical protein